MNLPSLDKYEAATTANGYIFADSSLIERKVERTDLNVFYIPATQMASSENLSGLANMIILGKLLKECDVMNYENVPEVLKKLIPAKRQHMYDLNIKAIELGYNYNA